MPGATSPVPSDGFKVGSWRSDGLASQRTLGISSSAASSLTWPKIGSRASRVAGEKRTATASPERISWAPAGTSHRVQAELSPAVRV